MALKSGLKLGNKEERKERGAGSEGEKNSREKTAAGSWGEAVAAARCECEET